jgi:hypothetical protein
MPGRPFETRIQFRLKSLFIVTTVVAAFAWLATFDVGRALVITVLCVAAFVGFEFFVLALLTWILGTPGERQRRSGAFPAAADAAAESSGEPELNDAAEEEDD